VEATIVLRQISLRLQRLAWQSKDGQDLIEYALMAAFVAVAVGATFPTTIGPNICAIMEKVHSCLQSSAAAS
jgi:Flp pilus assembly pilin Flp